MRGIVAVAGIIGVIAIASCTATSSSSGAKQNSPAAADTSVAAGKPKPQTLLKLKGSGTKTTQKFTAAGDWDLDWSYDCSGFGAQGNFQVFVYDSAGGISENIPVNQLGRKGSGVEHYHQGGKLYLEVNSECQWSVNVVG